MHHKSAFLFFFYPVYLVKYVIQNGIFFFLKKGIFGSTFLYRQQIIPSQIVIVSYTYKLIDLYFSRPTYL